MNCLPTETKEIFKLPKQYLINVIYTIVGQQFADWVTERIEERNQKVAVDGNLMIEVDAEVARAYNNSTAVSLYVIFRKLIYVSLHF